MLLLRYFLIWIKDLGEKSSNLDYCIKSGVAGIYLALWVLTTNLVFCLALLLDWRAQYLFVSFCNYKYVVNVGPYFRELYMVLEVFFRLYSFSLSFQVLLLILLIFSIQSNRLFPESIDEVLRSVSKKSFCSVVLNIL